MKICQREVADARSDLFHFNGGVLLLLFVLGDIPGGGFEIMQIITGFFALALIVYLFISIFKPEKF
jgi:K+-transporting ATPase KdpF subunit